MRTRAAEKSKVSSDEQMKIHRYREFYKSCREELAPFIEWVERNGPPSEEAAENLSAQEQALMSCAVVLCALWVESESGEASSGSSTQYLRLIVCRRVEALLDEASFISPLSIRRKLQSVLGGEIHA